MLYFDELDSTNSYVRAHAHELEDGTMVASGIQTSGRGRLGRKWIAAPGHAAMATFLLKQVPDGGSGAGIVCALAGLDAVRECAPGLQVWLKWPNDLYVFDRKLAGILCESTGIAQGRVLGVAAGIGINVNTPPEELERIDRPATSILAECGKSIPVKKILEKLEIHLKRYYIMYLNNREFLDARWRKENLLIGCEIDFDTATGSVRGIVRGIAPQGELEVESAGSLLRFNCGDVRIRREALRKHFGQC